MNPATLRDAMQQVNGLLQAGEFRAAHARLAALVIDHPDDPEAQRLLAGTKLALGDAEGAEQVLREAAELQPPWPPVLTMLGELLLDAGSHDEAERFLRRAATGNPADLRAALVLARHCNDRQRPAQALAVAEPLCATGAASVELVAQHVAALVALGRKKDALAFYRDLAVRMPTNPAVAQALAIVLQVVGMHAEAAVAAESLLGHGHRSAALLHTLARSRIAVGEFVTAEAALRDCLQLEPQRVDAHDDLARLVWMRSGDCAEATATLDEALRRFNTNDALAAAKAAVLQGAGDPRAAYECLATRAERPAASPALLVRAGLSALEFDPAIALALADRVLRRQPDNRPARKLKVAAQLGIGEADAALPICEALLRDEPDEQYLIALQTTAWRLLGDERYARLCDYRKWVVPYRLEAPSSWRSLEEFLGDLKASLGKLHDALRHPLLFQSLRHGTETTEDLARSEDPVLQALFKAFDAPIRDYMARIGHGVDPLPRRNTGAYRFNGSWSVRLRVSGFHQHHVHPRGWISSACYIELPEEAANANSHEGALGFGQPGILTQPALGDEHEIRPEPGMLVLFPSYCWHGTVPFAHGRTRLTVAFDVVPA